MADKTGKPWMAAGETDDPNAEVESYEADGDVAKGVPVYLTSDGKAKQGNGSYNAIGITLEAALSGAQCPVLQHGRVKVVADGAFDAAGCAVRSAGNTKVTQLFDQDVNEAGAATYSVYYNRKLGTALQKADADGDLIFINVER
jgi:hypothetical protein